jgi:hypothetical protein
MSHFAEINSDNIVQRVLVIDQETVNTGAWGASSNWIQTSYNTRGGVHYAPNSHTPDNGVALRKNYAGQGFTYDATRDAFYEPQPYASWTLDDDTCQWNPPTAYPDDGKMYDWDEDNTEWKEIE